MIKIIWLFFLILCIAILIVGRKVIAATINKGSEELTETAKQINNSDKVDK